MNVVRKVEVTKLEISRVESVTEAEQVMKMILGGEVTDQAERDAANGLVEAFFVTYLRNVDKTNLLDSLNSLNKSFGEYNPFKRAVARVKTFRPKNPCWKHFAA